MTMIKHTTLPNKCTLSCQACQRSGRTAALSLLFQLILVDEMVNARLLVPQMAVMKRCSLTMCMAQYGIAQYASDCTGFDCCCLKVSKLALCRNTRYSVAHTMKGNGWAYNLAVVKVVRKELVANDR